MKLNLKRDIVFFDIESTGLSTSKDRIVQLAIVKHFVDGRPPLEKCRLVNPTIPISKEAMEVHGITDELVANEPTFKQIANGLISLIGDADLCGFNSNRFDIPMLVEEFDRAGVVFDMSKRKMIDVWKIFQKMEPRTLSSAYKMYCGKELEGAHDALSDVRATIEVLESQLDYYKDIPYTDGHSEFLDIAVPNDMDALSDFTVFKGQLDLSGRFILNDNGVAVFNFGKYQGKTIDEAIRDNRGYEAWFLNGDFTTDTKNIFRSLMDDYRKRNNIQG